MLIGLVKWYDAKKGFGLIGTPDQGDFFIHSANLKSEPIVISMGEAVVFSTRLERKKTIVDYYRLVGQLEDWELIVSHFGKSDLVQIEATRDRRGRPESSGFSLLKVSINQFFKGKSESVVTEVVLSYFDNGLDKRHFVRFCDLISNAIRNNFRHIKSSTKEFSSNNQPPGIEEIIKYHDILKKQTNDFLQGFYDYFSKNVNDEMLFWSWKANKLEYISYPKHGDVELSMSILRNYASELETADLKRILNFSFAAEFLEFYIHFKFSQINELNSAQILDLYPLLEFVANHDQERKKEQLDRVYFEKIETEFIGKAKALRKIESVDDLSGYTSLIFKIPYKLEQEAKEAIEKAIHKIISSRSVEKMKPELWLRGIISEAPFDLISNSFLDPNNSEENQLTILSKLEEPFQLELIKKIATKSGFESAFRMLDRLVRKLDQIGSHLNLDEILFDKDFWQDKNSGGLVELFNNHVHLNATDEEKFHLFFKGFVKDVPMNQLVLNCQKLDEQELRRVFESQKQSKDLPNEILSSRVRQASAAEMDWLYDLAIDFLKREHFGHFDEVVFKSIGQEEYFKFWKTGKAKKFPRQYIKETFGDSFEPYEEIDSWIKSGFVAREVMCEMLYTYINIEESVENRSIFYKQFNHIKYLLVIDSSYLTQIRTLNNGFYNVLLWFLDKEEVLNFHLLKDKFIYFSPTDQVRIIRKLFWLKAKGQFDLTLEKLDELSRFDIDLYKTQRNFNPDIPIDLSTEVVINALLSFRKNQRFFIESELFTTVLNSLRNHTTYEFKLDNYFEACRGRMVYKFDWSRQNGTISKVEYGDNKFYFAISFDYSEELVEKVRQIPSRRWNSSENHWGVKAQYEKDVLEFAQNNRFFVDFEGGNAENNPHFAYFYRDERPTGVLYCEGRLSNSLDYALKTKFWWCAGQQCFEKCETIHPQDEWMNYTLLDFCEILGFNTDETNAMGDHIDKGMYYQFISLVNRFNRMLDRLYCLDCNHILFPSDFGTANFASRSVVRFQCRNESCSNNEEIYLNHCLNGKCNGIIDSRVSKQCSNGLTICENCGSCCSHKMLQKRLNDLELNGGHIHADLRKCVQEKLGHLERAEYFCHNCATPMQEIKEDVFRCTDCEVEYNTVKYRIQRPHIHLNPKRVLRDGNREGF